MHATTLKSAANEGQSKLES